MCGCIPVGTATGGIPEMLGGQGVLAAAADHRALADAIQRAAELAARPSERIAVATVARDTYSATAVAGQLTELWHQIATQEQP